MEHVKITANQFIYTPAKDFIGTDTFTYKANDGRTDSPYAKVIIHVSKNTAKSNIKPNVPTSKVPIQIQIKIQLIQQKQQEIPVKIH